MKKLIIILALAVLLVPSATFAKEKTVKLSTREQIAVLVEQIRILQERVYVLELREGIATTTPKTIKSKKQKAIDPARPSCTYEVGSARSGYRLSAQCGG